MEDDLLQLGQLVLEPRLEIGFVEELGVAQSRGEHLAVALDDLRATVRRRDIGGADEGVGQRAVLPATDEILLVHPRGELDHLRRHGEERFVEPAEQRHRPFGEASIFGDQPFVLDQREPGVGGEGRGGVADQRGALFGIDDDVARAQLLDIIGGRADRDRAGMVEAVAERRRPAGDAGDLERHDLLAQQRDHALQRAHPAQALGRLRGGAPAHRLGPGKGADDRRDRLGEHGGGLAAGLVHHREPPAVAVFELVPGQAGLAQETVERLARRRGARALGLLGGRRGFVRQIARDQREAARGGIGDDRAGFDAGLRQFGGEQPREIIARLRLHPRRDFLRAEFEQEVGHNSSPARGGCTVAITPPTRSCPSTRCTRPSPDRGRGRCTPDARPPRSRRAPAAG